MHDHAGKVTSLSRLSAQVQPCHNTTRREDEKLKLRQQQHQQQLNSSCLFRSRPARLSCAHVRASAQMSNHSVPVCEVPRGWLAFLALTCLVAHLALPRISCAPVSLVCLLVSLSLLSPSHFVCLPSGHANKIAENPQPTKVLTNAFGLRWHLSRFVRDSEAICARFARLSKLSASKVSFVQGGVGEAGQVSTEIKQKGLPNAISYLGAWQANLTEAAAVAAVAFELSNSRRMMSH